MQKINKINLQEKLDSFNEHWSPKIISELNGQHVKVAKLKGEFIWHKHEKEDELFMVLAGSLVIEFRDKVVNLKEGEIITIPKGVEHRPIATEEVAVMLFEPVSTLNTGDQLGEMTVDQPEWI
jgi:mannose-6-phosphate isomerase-like protein (cupin superfamily)